MNIQPNTKLLMLGDSITDSGRVRPIAEASGEALGTGYVSLINACLTATSSQRHMILARAFLKAVDCTW